MAQGPPGAVDAGEVEVGEAGGEFAEGGEVGEGGVDADGAVVGADAFAAAAFAQFGVMTKPPVSSFSTASPYSLIRSRMWLLRRVMSLSVSRRSVPRAVTVTAMRASSGSTSRVASPRTPTRGASGRGVGALVMIPLWQEARALAWHEHTRKTA